MSKGTLDRVLGVELKFLKDNRISCRFSLVMRQGDLVDIVQEKQLEGTLVEVLQVLPKQHPIALNITGKGLLNKKLPILDDSNVDALFHQAFPGVDRNDFHIQKVFGANNGLISIIRKQIVDELLGKMLRAGLVIYSFSLGAMVSSVIWPQLNSYGQELKFDGHFFKLDENREFLSYENGQAYQSQFPVKVGETPIDQQLILAYASAFQLLLHDRLLQVRADVAVVNVAFDNFIFNSHLQKKTKYFIFSLFGMLLLSFLLFSHYSEKNAQLMSSLGAKSADADQAAILQKNILDNETLLKRLNWNGGYHHGFLLTELGSSLPMQLRLNELSINDYKSDKEKPEHIPLIRILGSSNDPLRVNNWIFELKKKPWVKSVALLKFQEDRAQEQYQFTLNITY